MVALETGASWEAVGLLPPSARCALFVLLVPLWFATSVGIWLNVHNSLTQKEHVPGAIFRNFSGMRSTHLDLSRSTRHLGGSLFRESSFPGTVASNATWRLVAGRSHGKTPTTASETEMSSHEEISACGYSALPVRPGGPIFFFASRSRFHRVGRPSWYVVEGSRSSSYWS